MDALLVTLDDLELLRSFRNPTGYRCVYEAHRGERQPETLPRYIAKIRVRGKLFRLKGSTATPTDCARRVVQWYQQQFGQHWQTVATNRQVRIAVTRAAAPGPR